MSAVRVAVRTRPSAAFAEDCIKIDRDRQSIGIQLPKQSAGAHERSENQKESWQFSYDQVLHNTGQQALFDDVVAPVVDSVLAGYNGTVMCYGQTGAGKTYTHIGSTSSYAQRGLAPRAISRIFQQLEARPQHEAVLTASYVELHNDQLIDLLSHLPSPVPRHAEPLVIGEDKNGSISIKGLRSIHVANEEAALTALFEGESARSVAEHQLNHRSSRGHAVFTLTLAVKSRVESSDRMTRAKLVMVDLAGSERLKKTHTTGELKVESMYINKSLSYLEQVVVALASRSRSHTPYRQTKLTHLLKDAIGGNSKTVLLANIHTEARHLEETIATLEFASRIRAVRNSAAVVEATEPEMMLRNYKQQVTELRRELAMHDSLSNRSRVSYDPFTEAERRQAHEQMESFLEQRGGDLPLESVRQFKELLAAARTIYGDKVSQLETLQRQVASGGTDGIRVRPGGDEDAATGGRVAEHGGVGDMASASLSFGKAPDSARPPGGVRDPPHAGGSGVPSAPNSLTPGPTGVFFSAGGTAPLGREAAFEEFKRGEGQTAAQALAAAKARHKALRLERQELAALVNAHKAEIDRCRVGVDAKSAARGAGGSISGDGTVIIDEEEYALLQALRSAKLDYKREHEQLLHLAAAFDAAGQAVADARQQLLDLFTDSFTNSNGADGAADDVVLRPAGAAPTVTRSPESGGTASSKGFGSGHALSSSKTFDAPEPLDESELFEQMQLARVLRDEPESLAFMRASMGARGRARH